MKYYQSRIQKVEEDIEVEKNNIYINYLKKKKKTYETD